MLQKKNSRASMTVSVAGAGRRFGHIVLPWSRNESGWGSLRIPLAILSSGRTGPTVLLVGGSHGDEFEGPIALSELCRTIDPNQVHGTTVVVPALNLPAVKSGQRLSPIDGGNMNRAFRGRHDGTITEQIADFVEQELVARADAVLDIHAGGRSMMFHPFAAIHALSEAAEQARAMQALIAFGAPVGLVLRELDNEGMLDTATERRGKLFLSTELGGGGSTTRATLDLARRGILSFLAHVGALDAEDVKLDAPTRLMTTDAASYVSCERSGLIEYLQDLGSTLSAGEPIARIFDLDRLNRAADEVLAPNDGLFLGRHHGGIVEIGDFLALIARDL